MRTQAVAILASIPFLVSCTKSETGSGAQRYADANVILITLDTVRADHLGCYGYSRPTTPNLDQLAKECVRFSRAFAQSSYTPPSHASILTSRYPSSHGLFGWEWKLPGEVPTLAEVLKEGRYQTAMFSPLGMGQGNALNQGFETVAENYGEAMGYSLPIEGAQFPYKVPPANVVLGYFDRWQASLEARPFFSWIHLYDAHRPYSIFDDTRTFCEDKKNPFGNDTMADYQLTPEKRSARGIGEAQAKYLIDRYDSGLLDLDRKVGKLIADLRAKGTLDQSILVITADHGEAFTEFEEEWFTHDPFVFDPVTHVPLLIRFPDGKFGGKTVDHLAQSIDIMPTILDYLGRAIPPLTQGVSLRNAIERNRPVNDFVACERKGRTTERVDDPNEKGKTIVRLLPPEKVVFTRSLRFARDRLVFTEFNGKYTTTENEASGVERPSQPDPDSPAYQGQLRFFADWKRRVEVITPRLDARDLEVELRKITALCPGY